MISDRSIQSGRWSQGSYALVALVLFILFGEWTPNVIAQCRYEVTLIPRPVCPDGYSPSLSFEAFGESGDAVFTADGCGSGDPDNTWYWSEETGLVHITSFDGSASDPEPTAILEDGTVVLNFFSVSGLPRWTMLWHPDHGVCEVIATPDQGDLIMFDMSNPDLGVGRTRFELEENDPVHGGVIETPYRYQDGVFTPLNMLGHVDGQAIAINRSGTAAGLVWTESSIDLPIRWTPNGAELLERVAGTERGRVYDINNHGTVAGYCRRFASHQPGQERFPVLWENTNPIIQTCSVDKDGAVSGSVRGINDAKTAVGSCLGLPIDAFAALWIDDEVYPLRELTEPDGFEVVVLNNAFAVNNNGEILVGIARYDLPNGETESAKAILMPIGRPIEDVTQDCRVDQRDIHALLNEWRKEDSYADINQDGTVDVVDLLAVLSNWTN